MNLFFPKMFHFIFIHWNFTIMMERKFLTWVILLSYQSFLKQNRTCHLTCVCCLWKFVVVIVTGCLLLVQCLSKHVLIMLTLLTPHTDPDLISLGVSSSSYFFFSFLRNTNQMMSMSRSTPKDTPTTAPAITPIPRTSGKDKCNRAVTWPATSACPFRFLSRPTQTCSRMWA